MTKIGLIAMSAKPLHSGHWGLIEIASKENDIVMLFVSLSDRIRPNEFPILGASMERIWREHAEHALPSNVRVVYGGSPIHKIIKVLGDSSQANSQDTFSVYGDTEDIASNFPDTLLKKYCGNLFKTGQVILRPIARSETTDISGTKMRQFLQDGARSAFIMNVPECIDGAAIWDILRPNTHECMALLKSFVTEAVRNKAAAKRRSR